MGSEDMGKVRDPLVNVIRWVKTRPPGTKIGLAVGGAVLLLLTLWRTIKDHDTLFVLAEIAHFIGIGVLGYKLQQKESVAGRLEQHRSQRSSFFRCSSLFRLARVPSQASRSNPSS
jgi:ER lumen protein retaining receptor